MATLRDVIERLQVFAPLELAESWDNVGLLLGDPATAIDRIMTCLTVTPATVAEAVRDQAQLVVSHHPVLFRPTQKLTTATGEGRILLPLLQAGVAVYSPHTAFDNAPEGINELLAKRFGLSAVAPLRRVEGAPPYKIVVFVPEKDLEAVSDALFEAGAGVIGQYNECSFRIPGTGTFFGTEESNPSVGMKGRREHVPEVRLEVVCPAKHLNDALRAVKRTHSYEVPSFDVYPVRDGLSTNGVGRLGTLPQPQALATFARSVAATLNTATVQLVGDPTRPIHRVAIACGAGGELLKDAAQARADLFITGEARFHDCLAAEEQGLALLLAGHYATERPGVEDLAQRLQRDFPKLQVWASRDERDPLVHS